MFKLNENQLNCMFRRADTYTKHDGSTIKAYHEITHTEQSGVLTETEYLFCREGDLKQGDTITIKGEKHKVQYIKDNADGTIDAFITEHVGGGNYGKYR